MGWQIGERVRTRAGDLGVVDAVLDPQQIHVTLGEGMAATVQAFGPEELTRVDGPVDLPVEDVAAPAPPRRRGSRSGAPEAP